MVALAFKSALVTMGLSGALIAAQQQLTPTQRQYYAQQMASTRPQPAPSTIPADRLADAIVEWKRLRQSDSLGFDAYARFLIDHRGWPQQDGLRRSAERAIVPGSANPGLVAAFFDAHPPLTQTGHLRYAEALAAVQRIPEANQQAREAWRAAGLSPEDELRLLGRFSSALTPGDHDTRMDSLLWANATTAATRQLSFVTPARRPLFAARIAYGTRASDAAALGAAAAALGASDPGYLADRAGWQVANRQLAAARQGLATRRLLAVRPTDVEEWYEALLEQARNAYNDRQYQTAYDIARQVDDAYAPGTDVSIQPYGERDDYTSLVWLAGTTAFYEMKRPADAIGMFARYAGGSQTPQTRSKGYYWAGRAAEAAGQREVADRYYAQAAAYSDQFYGQLARERTGQPLTPPPVITATAPEPARQEFYRREVVRAAQMLGELGAWSEQTLFLRQIAMDAKSDTDHLLGAELAKRLNRPDLGVMVGRSARTNGLNDYVASGYPTVAIPPQHNAHWVIAHAIMRQESQFDRQAVSSAGARGMMQLMPGTAREQAGKLGLPYIPGNLTSDPMYNINIGSSYFRRMYDAYGSYPLALAAYNAGPGNVNKWLRANGDPRKGEVDWLRWLEQIPYSETKYYVQRVLENAVVYGLMNPQRATNRADAPLSRYIGKSQPG
ncbi:lytic transglycosylase domain-containing protein [Sphingomonas gilva]|uniref:Lytic transglycosylase domain-containing protein n=1 Tax=Sphingomonas gilva TaxID=2305907 RepID=A0A396RK43_9SPHN|nr:lytic transglycosylase domain-containing protein [Sphingomonas gilva]RHW16550.1 lytic transglycosylase domain-containing protein [Sphingomonas gilva]